MARVKRRDNHRLGLILTVSGVLVFSPDGLMLRLIGIDGLTLTAWRGFLAGLVILLGTSILHGRNVWPIIRAGGWTGLLLVALSAASMLAFNMAITNTSVANVLVTFAIMPMLAALMAWVFLGERLRPDTGVALFFAVLGMLIVAAGATAGGGMRGLVYAVLNAVVVAGYFVAVRHLRGKSAIPFVGMGYLLAGLFTWPFVSVPDLTVEQFGLLLANGMVLQPLAIALISLGPRYLPAPEVALITLLETILGPLLVWLVLAEDPGPYTLAGGAIIILTLCVHSARRLARAGNRFPGAGP
ncbi:MAG: DMT family transporter [Boseongicola sp. SB0676_bin_33]|uniref:DMT family transporter n=1 Tax=Boseongicola sp. SB0664_bin_43 TaxID=2604844 RepID=A0A6B0Y3M7_9RHOB|nr:DMT family transporter [Boseongicola sp. SB0664_bin_43]MYF90319.1 DMT family transporter [Boseongicola sp. SB0676_bin_33]MYK30918.1 DMT family transporter [Boseongicola sp. SB0670_bin_30]